MIFLNRSDAPARCCVVVGETPADAVFVAMADYLFLLRQMYINGGYPLTAFEAAIKRNLKVKGARFDGMTVRPFGFRFIADGLRYRMSSDATNVSIQLIDA